MRKIRDVLRLKLEARFSHDQVAGALQISKGVISKYLNLANTAGLIRMLTSLRGAILEWRSIAINGMKTEHEAWSRCPNRP